MAALRAEPRVPSPAPAVNAHNPRLLRFAARSASCLVEHLNNIRPDVKSRFQAGNLI
jgi:hypothetical protein